MKGCQPTVYLKKHNLKVENYVLFSELSEDFKTRRQHLKLPRENCSEEAMVGSQDI